MSWTEIREKRSGKHVCDKLKEAKYLIEEVCEELESETYSERRAWRIEEDDRYDHGYNERRRMR